MELSIANSYIIGGRRKVFFTYKDGTEIVI